MKFSGPGHNVGIAVTRYGADVQEKRFGFWTKGASSFVALVEFAKGGHEVCPRRLGDARRMRSGVQYRGARLCGVCRRFRRGRWRGDRRSGKRCRCRGGTWGHWAMILVPYAVHAKNDEAVLSARFYTRNTCSQHSDALSRSDRLNRSKTMGTRRNREFFTFCP